MAKTVNYTVAREHLGDKLTDDGLVPHYFEAGETREADPSVVKALVNSGVLIDPAAKKAEGAPANKAEGSAALNKGGEK